MCGIAGEICFHGKPVLRDRLLRMGEAIAHRGPDGDGIWMSGSNGFIHRRLALVDLSPSGAQPMEIESGSFVITFNGEIYNYQELRRELELDGVSFFSTSDTEVLLRLYAQMGERCLERLRGMFAFALWDDVKQQLFFARDRIGKKPFYYSLTNDSFIFASEIKSILSVSDQPRVDWTAVRLFLGLQYVPSPRTGFKNITSLPAGSYGILPGQNLVIKTYTFHTRTPKFTGTLEEAAGVVRRTLDEAVHYRLNADVPIGSFLSGGMDSSIVTALMAKAAPYRIQTFTMGFPDYGQDERIEAARFSSQLGTEHHAFEARPQNVIDFVDRSIHLFDSPYADSSAIAVLLLAQQTKPYVKSAMVGDGGDELFGGYKRYQAFLRASFLARGKLGGVSALLSRQVGRWKQDPRFLRFAQTCEGMKRSFGSGYAALFTGSYFSEEELKRLIIQDGVLDQSETASAYIESQFDESLGVEGALAFDLMSYLPDDLNIKMDRATMAVGLEARAPFLDQELVRFAERLPLQFLLKRGKQKPLLRIAFDGIVPREIFERPKRGFQLPLAHWFRHELRPLFLERCLSPASPLCSILKQNMIKEYLDANDRGVDHGNRLWMLLVLASWLDGNDVGIRN